MGPSTRTRSRRLRPPRSVTAGIIGLWTLWSASALHAQTAYWEPVNLSLTSRILCLASSPRGLIFAGTDDRKVLRSTNGGLTWTESGGAQLSPAIWSLAVDPLGTVFAGTDFRGLYRSTDDGATWLPSNLTSQRIACLLLTQGGALFAGAWNEGIYRSTDGGVLWNLVGAPDHKVRSLVETPDGTLIAGTDTIAQEGRLYRSTDGGASWSRVGLGLSGGIVHSLVSVSAETLVAGTAGEGIYLSTNAGDFWSPSNPLVPTTVHALAYLPAAGIFAGLESGGILRTTDRGGTWGFETSGLQNLEVRCLMIGPDGHLYAGTGEGLYRSTRVLTHAASDRAADGLRDLALSAYPNPFNAETVLRFSLPAAGPVRLSAFDLRGRKIPILEKTVHHAGSHTVRWVADNLASGAYVVVLETPGRMLSSMVLLIK